MFDGEVPRSEADEYVQITNYGEGPQELVGWVLQDKTDRRQSFVFPEYTLVPGKTIRVYTKQVHEEWGGFSFDIGRAIWHNKEADTAELLDGSGEVVSSKSYDVKQSSGMHEVKRV